MYWAHCRVFNCFSLHILLLTLINTNIQHKIYQKYQLCKYEYIQICKDTNTQIPVHPAHSLCVMTGVPAGVKDHNPVRSDQVHAKASRSRGHKEEFHLVVKQGISQPSFWFFCVFISIWSGEVNFLVFFFKYSKPLGWCWIRWWAALVPSREWIRRDGSKSDPLATRPAKGSGCFGFLNVHSIKILSCFNIFWDSRTNNLYICNKCWEKMWEIFIY